MERSVLLCLCFVAVFGYLPNARCQQPGDVKLVGYEASRTSGRLEVYLNGQWGSVCGYRFDMLAATVVCRQLGLGLPVEIVENNRFDVGISTSPIAVGEVVCEGDESHLMRCHYREGSDLALLHQCQSHSADIGVVCAGEPLSYDGSVRLMGGAHSSVGVAQMFLNNKWLPVCSSGFTQQVADKFCKQLGYTDTTTTTALSLTSSEWVVVSSCSSSVECLKSCLPQSPVPSSMCGSNMRIEVECALNPSSISSTTTANRSTCELAPPTPADLSVRLTPSQSDNEGLMEVYSQANSGWLGVCHDDQFSLQDADVLCKQIGYSAALKSTAAQINSSHTVTISLSCSGTEYRLSQCAPPTFINNSNCGAVAEIKCHNEVPPFGSLRLYNGAGSSGSLYLFDGSVTVALFRPVCDVGFGVAEARVACRQLGYQDVGGATAYSNTYYGKGPHNFPFVSRTFNCSENETNLLDCAASSTPFTTCRFPYDIVGVTCAPTQASNPSVQLGGSSTGSSGVLEVMVDGSWRQVCADSFSVMSGDVACREKGFAGLSTVGTTTASNSSSLLTSLQCAGWEERLVDCPFSFATSCQGNNVVTLECSSSPSISNGTLRLVDNSSISSNEVSGRLEVSYNGVWMSVCGLFFSQFAADAACRQLNYSASSGYCGNACNGSSSGLVFFAEDHCSGGEESLFQCMLDPHQHQLCSHDHDVGLTCVLHAEAAPSLPSSSSSFSSSSSSSLSSLSSSSSSSSSSSLSVSLSSSISVSPSATISQGFSVPPVGSVVPPTQPSTLPQYIFYAIGGGASLLLSAIFVVAVACCAWCCKKKKRRIAAQNSGNVQRPSRQRENGVTSNGTLSSSGETSIADVKEDADWKRQFEGSFPHGYDEPDFGGASPALTLNGGHLAEEPPRYDELEFASLPVNGRRRHERGGRGGERCRGAESHNASALEEEEVIKKEFEQGAPSLTSEL